MVNCERWRMPVQDDLAIVVDGSGRILLEFAVGMSVICTELRDCAELRLAMASADDFVRGAGPRWIEQRAAELAQVRRERRETGATA